MKLCIKCSQPLRVKPSILVDLMYCEFEECPRVGLLTGLYDVVTKERLNRRKVEHTTPTAPFTLLGVKVDKEAGL